MVTDLDVPIRLNFRGVYRRRRRGRGWRIIPPGCKHGAAAKAAKSKLARIIELGPVVA